MNQAASRIECDDYKVAIANDGVPVVFMPPLSPDDPWRLEFDLRAVEPYLPTREWEPEFEDEDHRPRWVPEFAEHEFRPPPSSPPRAPRPAAHARAGGHLPRAGLQGMAASGRNALGEGDGGDEDEEPATALDRPGPSRRSAPRPQSSQPGPATLAAFPSSAACRPTSSIAITLILEMARARLVTAAELCGAVVQVIVEEKNRGDGEPTLPAPPTKAPPGPEWQTPPGAARTVGVPVKIVRAMIKAKRITSRLRNVTPNPKQPKYLVNVHELEAVLARDPDPIRAPPCPDNVRELAARIRAKASRR